MRKRKHKLSKIEKINRQIESWERKQEAAVVMLRRSAEMLLKLRRQRQRLLAKATATQSESPAPEQEPKPLAPEPSKAECPGCGSTSDAHSIMCSIPLAKQLPDRLDLVAAPPEVSHEALAVPAKREAQDRRSLDDDTVLKNEPGTKVATRDLDKHDDGIPDFLRRGQAAQKAADAITESESNRLSTLPDPRAPEKKAERRAIEKEVREAELTGKRRKMPLTGKDALAAIADRETRMKAMGFRKIAKKPR